jgi:hypothetical protein
MPERHQTATASSVEPTATARPSGAAYDSADRGAGWLFFAGVMIGIVGVLNSIYGIAAISNSKVFVRDAQYILSDLNTYGWVLLIIGVIQMCAAFGIVAGAGWGRWVGILSAGVNSIVQLLVMPARPYLALMLYAVDILVIYGLVAYGGRRRTAA